MSKEATIVIVIAFLFSLSCSKKKEIKADELAKDLGAVYYQCVMQSTYDTITTSKKVFYFIVESKEEETGLIKANLNN